MSTIATNTITNVAGNATGVGIAVSNAATYNSEGGNVSQNFVQGLCKAWVHALQHVSQDSLNIASSTDNGTGDYTFTYTNGFNNVNYCAAASNQSTRNGQGLYVGNFATSSFRINPSNSSGTPADYNTTTIISGDLA